MSSLVKIRFTKLSKNDFDEALNYYKKESDALASRFRTDIIQSVNRILSFPHLYPQIAENIHKCVASKFPFTIFYLCKEETIFIIAIANHYKNPETYSSRF